MYHYSWLREAVWSDMTCIYLGTLSVLGSVEETYDEEEHLHGRPEELRSEFEVRLAEWDEDLRRFVWRYLKRRMVEEWVPVRDRDKEAWVESGVKLEGISNRKEELKAALARTPLSIRRIILGHDFDFTLDDGCFSSGDSEGRTAD
ncbi:hypothetical protein VUR80DRAFT_9992 [Thermomyces stellatus]